MTPEQKLDLLKEAQALIIFEENWCKNKYALNRKGKECISCHIDAVAWSTIGAIDKAFNLINSSYNYDDALIHIDFDLIVKELELDANCSLLEFNNDHSHKEVIQLFYKTMERIATSIGLNMYYPLFPEDMDTNAMAEGFVLFVPKECDEALETASKEQEDMMEEAIREDAEARYYSSLKDD